MYEMNLEKIDKYVRMCKEATELQENHKSEIGDYYYLNWLYESNTNLNRDICDFLVCEADEWQGDVFRPWADYGFPEQYESNIKNSTWLPRQDQLQDMILQNVHITLNETEILLRKFSIFSISIYAKRVNATSMEQLWLSYVMYDRYGKFWNGVKWV